MVDKLPNRRQKFTAVDLRNWFNLSSTTLFRWEREGKITGVRKQPISKHHFGRVYEIGAVRQVAQLCRQKLENGLVLGYREGGSFMPSFRDLEILYRGEVLVDYETGFRRLRQLTESHPLSEDTIGLLAKEATRIRQGHPFRIATWQTIGASDARAR